MKPTNKIVKFVVLPIIILFVVLWSAFYLLGGLILKAGVEKAATKTLAVPVTIEDMDISILKAAIGINGLIVQNPPGYTYKNLLELSEARVTASIGSLLNDTVHIKELKLDGMNLVIEQKVLSNNLQEVISSISAKGKQQSESETAGKKLHIDNLEITNVTVKAKLLPVPGKADTVTIKLNPIRMTDLGGDDKLDVAELSGKILLAIATGVAGQGAGLLPEGMTDTMKATLSETAELGKTAVKEGKELLEEGKDTGKKLIEGFKGLLKPKKK